jgi:pimeloyl-ACP methyl ester carboxylesterase
MDIRQIHLRQIKSDDAEITYRMLGEGSPVVLLHPFPVNHEFWLPVAETLSSRYRVVLPDMRGHGDSGVGEGPATMDKHAADIARVMDDAEVGRAPLIGVSIGGYALFEFWRRHRGRVAALGLCNTKATAAVCKLRTTLSIAARSHFFRAWFCEPFPGLRGKCGRTWSKALSA